MSKEATLLGSVFKEFFSPVTMVAWAAFSLILGLSRPFGLVEIAPVGGRIFYWAILIGVALLIALFFNQMARRALRGRSYFLIHLVTAVLFAAAMAPVVYFMDEFFYPDHSNSSLQWWPVMAFLALVFASVAMIVETAKRQFQTAVEQKVEQSDDQMSSNSASKRQADAPAPNALLEKLDDNLRNAPVTRLAMQDHYVEVHTSQGSQLILMRMSDAIAELADYDGLQVHRSHWVAADQVKSHIRENGRLFLQTADGARVPVSRSFKPLLREAGWI